MTSHQHWRAGEVPVSGGRMTSGMVRRGDRLLRPMGPWSPAVHEYLRHLEAAGFDGAPRLLGIEGDREVLTFIEGDVANDPRWQPGHGHRLPPYARTDLALRGAGRLIRKLHTAAAGFRPRITGYRSGPRPPGSGEIVSHGDLGPWNTVYRDGIPVAFIDWDAAQPAGPLADLAAAARTFVPLAPPGHLAEAGFDPLPDLAARAAHVPGRLPPHRPQSDPAKVATLRTGGGTIVALAAGYLAGPRPQTVTGIHERSCGNSWASPPSPAHRWSAPAERSPSSPTVTVGPWRGCAGSAVRHV